MTDKPLSRPIAVADLPADGLEIEIVADERERAALATLNESPAIDRVVARLRATPAAGGVVVVTGRVLADVTRTCVVTLEPFVEAVDEPIDVRFAPAADLPEPEPGEEIELGRNEPPDPYDGTVLDLGEVVSEFLTLGLDPHPRKPGAVFEQPSLGSEAPSPFAALAQLKPGDERS